MNGSCENHPFEMGDDLCGHCGREYCQECLVYPRGPKKPPFCIPCALTASGVRSTAARVPAISKRELKRRRKERSERTEVEVAQRPPGVSAAMDWDTISSGGESDRPVAVPVESEDEEIVDYSPASGAWDDDGANDRFSQEQEEFKVLRPAFDEKLTRIN